MKKPAGSKDEQARTFRELIISLGMVPQTSWQTNGFTFELFRHKLVSLNAALLMETYPQGHGFEVWIPATASQMVVDTENAVREYIKTKEAGL